MPLICLIMMRIASVTVKTERSAVVQGGVSDFEAIGLIRRPMTILTSNFGLLWSALMRLVATSRDAHLTLFKILRSTLTKCLTLHEIDSVLRHCE